MELRRLGKSDLMLSPIGMGCQQFCKGVGVIGRKKKNLNDNQIYDIVQASLNVGINWFDTAEAYGWGTSERSLRRALEHTLPKTYFKPAKSLNAFKNFSITPIIMTKWFSRFRTSRSIIDTIDYRLEALGVDCIDLHQIHHPTFVSIKKEMRAMAKLVEMGKVRYIGVSNFNAAQMVTAYEELAELGLPLVSNQICYNFNKRNAEEDNTLEIAKELEIGIVAYSPLDQGKLKRDALDWLTDKGIFALMGVSTSEQVYQNMNV